MPYNVPAGTRTIYGGRYSNPAWRLPIPALSWASIPTTLDEVDPADDPAVNPNFPSQPPWQLGTGPQSRVTSAFSGGAYCEDAKVFYVWGGGHGDYAGNELYRIDMTADAPVWERIRDPAQSTTYPGPSLDDGDESLGYYSGYDSVDDFQPRSYHTYGGLIVRDGLLYALPGSAPYKIGGNIPSCWAYNPATDRWTQLAQKPTTANNATFSSGAYDSLRDQWVYIPGGNNVIDVFDFGTQAWTAGAGGFTNFGASEARAVYYPPFDAVICFSNSLPGHVAYYELPLNPGVDAITASFSGSPPPETTNYGLVYLPSQNRIVAWIGGSVLYVLTPPASIAGTWAWSVVGLDDTTYTPPAQEPAGTWGRLAYDHDYDCLILVNRTIDPLIIGALS